MFCLPLLVQRKVSRACMVWPYPVERKEHQAAALPESHGCEDQWPQTRQFPAAHRGEESLSGSPLPFCLFCVPQLKRTRCLLESCQAHKWRSNEISPRIQFHCLFVFVFVFFFLSPQIKRINSEAYKRTFEEIVRNIDKMENECIPSVTLSKQEVTPLSFQNWNYVPWLPELKALNPSLGLIETPLVLLQFHFENVKYMQHQAETLRLINDGQVPCQFEFIQKPNEPTYCKPWLTANPHKGFVAQGGFHFLTRWSLCASQKKKKKKAHTV